MKLILFKLGSYYIIQVAIVILVLTQISAANELYINQVGNNLNLTVIQDGTDNKIIGINVTPITGNDNTISMTQQGNHMDVEGLVVGNNNTLTSYQGGDADTSFIRSSVVGNSNTMNLLQGKKLDGSVDNNDSGNHEQYITIIGDSNSVNTAQANSNGANSGHHMAHIITVILTHYLTYSMQMVRNEDSLKSQVITMVLLLNKEMYLHTLQTLYLQEMPIV